VAVPSNANPPLVGPSRPLGSPEIPQFHLPGRGGAKGVYEPRLYGAAHIQFADRRRRLDETRRVAFLLPLDPAVRTPDWEAATPTTIGASDLVTAPPAAAPYQPLPAGAMQVNTFARWAKQFDRWLARTQRIELATKQDPPEPVTLGPKRGGVSVDLVAIVWELVPGAEVTK
jgi:hypothetical protein